MNKLYALLMAVVLLLSLVACSEKDNNNPTAVHIWAYKLDQFISREAVSDSLDASAADTCDFRRLYNYEIVSGADGFSPRMSQYAGYDLDWNSFKQGYFVPENGNRTWFPTSLNLPGAFKVTNTGYFRMYRKIDVYAGVRAVQSIELRGLPIYSITNWDGNLENAVKLSDLVSGIASYDSVRIVCYDNYGIDKYYHQDAINDGYYLLETERTIFPNVNPGTGMTKMKKVAFIDVIGAASAQNIETIIAPTTEADMIFTMPVSLNSYQATDLNGIINK